MIISSIEKTFRFLFKQKDVLLLGLANWILTNIISLVLISTLAIQTPQPDFQSLAGSLSDVSKVASNIYALILGTAVIFIITSLISIFFTTAVYRYILRKNLYVALNEAPKVYVNLVVGRVLQFLIFLAIALVGVILSFAAAPLLFVIVPVIILIENKLIFMDLMICLKEKSPVDSIKSSWEYSNKFFWRILATSLLLGLIIGIPMIIIYLASVFLLGEIGSIIYGVLSGLTFPLNHILAVMMYVNIGEQRRS